MAAFPVSGAGVASSDQLVLRAAVAAYLGRYRGQSRLHTNSDLGSSCAAEPCKSPPVAPSLRRPRSVRIRHRPGGQVNASLDVPLSDAAADVLWRIIDRARKTRQPRGSSSTDAYQPKTNRTRRHPRRGSSREPATSSSRPAGKSSRSSSTSGCPARFRGSGDPRRCACSMRSRARRGTSRPWSSANRNAPSTAASSA